MPLSVVCRQFYLNFKGNFPNEICFSWGVGDQGKCCESQNIAHCNSDLLAES